MLEKLTKDTFSQFLNETFRLDAGGSISAAIELVEVKALGTSLSAEPWGSPIEVMRNEPFSVVFRGPHEPVLSQGMYRVEHDEMGVMEGLFLVPVAADDRGRYYEAVFN
jgi:hypothetical protein